mmetsp:Transcript_20457/g.2738  ORF Transcript_20457/g.2738 Transcript_20457/m.2738 type:complete len:82 (-) Transcript_20457:157-402(-)
MKSYLAYLIYSDLIIFLLLKKYTTASSLKNLREKILITLLNYLFLLSLSSSSSENTDFNLLMFALFFNTNIYFLKSANFKF